MSNNTINAKRYEAIREFGLLCATDPARAEAIECQIPPKVPATEQGFDSYADILIDLLGVR